MTAYRPTFEQAVLRLGDLKRSELLRQLHLEPSDIFAPLPNFHRAQF